MCCFGSYTCNNTDVFGEEGLTFEECTHSISSLTSMECFTGLCGNQMVYSITSMTVETCLQICASNGFMYAGLQK